METDILTFILSNGGAAVTNDLLFNLCDASTLLDLLTRHDKFVSCGFNGTPKVVARCNVRLCRAKECPGCGDLHLCKNYLLSGVCQFSQLRRGCLFSHDLKSAHNMEVLRANGLEPLSRAELCLLLLQSDSTLLPQICYDYNNGLGSSGQCHEGCHRLHVCEKYLSGDCSCLRTHDFSAPQPLKLLQERHIPEHLICSLKSVYANKDALRLADKKAGRTYRGSGHLSKRAVSCGDLLGAVDLDTDRVGAGRPNHRQRDKTEICMFFIKGHCKHEEHCFKAHDKMPYRWEVKQGGLWTPMAENETIEEDYCDPQKTYSSSSPPVHFDTMTSGSDEVRRLSTLNSVLQPDFIHTTDWLWYWEDESGEWHQYAAVSSEHRMASITSRELEEMYLKKEKDVVPFTAGSHGYSLSFQDMIQTNLKYGTKRLVRRRPRFVSAAEVQTTRKRPTNSTFTPEHWDKTLIPHTGYKRVLLQPSSQEYQEVQELFSQTMTRFNIVQVERIQNKALWEAFRLQNMHMRNHNGRKSVLEKKLFHGTEPKFVDTICATNFDWRVCGVNGTSYGQGSYFARDASYSHRFTGASDPRFMFLSRVLVGEFTKGSSEYRRPPSKDGGDVNLFDSCVNNVENPSIYVVFEKHQIYPEYVLQYQQKSSVVTELDDTLAARLKLRNAKTLSLSYPNPYLATSKPLIKHVVFPAPKLQASVDGVDLTRALASWRTTSPATPKTMSFNDTGIGNSPSVPSPTPKSFVSQTKSKVDLTRAQSPRRDDLLEAPIPARVPRRTLPPPTNPKPAIPSRFTSSTPSSQMLVSQAFPSRFDRPTPSSQMLVSSSRSSTKESYMLDCVRKL
ncbi:protein mono-ADP-ribosyltransferase PARP12 [Eucyclogobius newberryi]|uniref:protein mono-ADP-ribosyltransferase PARP12 n=1 Tax=Eucyclogobius newberryi TaxID=166745 RepID=UPI003B59BF5B